MRAQQPMFVQGRQGRRAVSQHGRPPELQRLRDEDSPQAVGGLVGVHPLDVVTAGRQYLESAVGVIVADRLRERTDRLTETVGCDQPRDRGVGDDGQPVHQIGQHRPCLHRGELIGITHQQEPGVRPNRFEQSRHHRQRHHRCLVDDDHIVRQPVLPVVPEPRRGVGLAAEQPMHRGGAQSLQPLAIHHRQLVDLELHGLLQPGGGFAGGRGQRDAQPRLAVQFGLLGEQGEQPRHRGGLAGTRSAGEHGQAPRQRHLGTLALLFEARREEPRDVRQFAGPRGGGQRPHIPRDLTLLEPVPVEVQQPLVEV